MFFISTSLRVLVRRLTLGAQRLRPLDMRVRSHGIA